MRSGAGGSLAAPQPPSLPQGPLSALAPAPYSTFTDVAARAGLLAPTVYGEAGTWKFIYESIGGGCAFIDYDNDGWMDLFILGGSLLGGAPPGATNRLYHNNRDGHLYRRDGARRSARCRLGLRCLRWRL